MFERDKKSALMCRQRVDVPCASVAFARPPHRLDLLFLKGSGPLTMLVYSPVGRLIEVERWVAAHGPDRMRSGSGLDPHVLRAEFPEVPYAWETFLHGADTRFLHLSAAGVATLFLEPGEDPATVLPGMRPGEADAVQEMRVGAPVKELTDRQIDALSLAVSMGYYEVPHRVTQRELAQRLDMSLSGLSRLLRRAEASVIAIHMDAMVDAGADEGHFRPFLDTAEGEQGREALRVRAK